MTQHANKIQQRKIEMDKEKRNEEVVSYEFQKGAGKHFRKIAYASGRVITVDLSNKDES
jgi:hypothetical protein|tara:strand:+ start:563 stop:739 length:177 start_codon:yes stop_codon:yes gene_type:complete